MAGEPVSSGGGPVGEGNYRVRQGDCIRSIAMRNKLFWETIWDDPANSEVKRIRKDPSKLLPGDRIEVPDIREKHDKSATEQRHRFRRKGVPSVLKLTIKDEDEPRADVPYRLVIDGVTYEGTTDSEGRIEQAISPDARSGHLYLGEEEEELVLQLGHIDPPDETTGAQGRLANLGYYCGAVDNDFGPLSKAALRQFQEDTGKEASGDLDAATLDALKEAHGC